MSSKLTNAEAAQMNARNVTKASLQNQKPKYLSTLSIDALVTEEGSQDILYSFKKKDMQMTPYSNFNFPTSWDNQNIVTETYTLHLVAKFGDNEWECEKDFEIAVKDPKFLNDEAVELKK